jgi:hypothetical protein
MFRLRSYLPVVWLLLTAVAIAPAQSSTRPNFTGIWNLDKEKSDFGGLPAPQSARYLIRHVGAKLEMQLEQDSHTTRVDIIPDGQEHLLETLPDAENFARVYWDGSVLVFDGRIKPSSSSQSVPIKWISRWSLSPDKRAITIERHLTAQQASADQKLIYDKEVPAKKAQ